MMTLDVIEFRDPAWVQSREASRLRYILFACSAHIHAFIVAARGKSYISKKAVGYVKWRGEKADIFNAGKRRRQLQLQDPQVRPGRHGDGRLNRTDAQQVQNPIC
jgi:hypothetical protein